MAKQRYSSQQVADALAKSRGLVSVAARNLGCKDDTVRVYIERYPLCRAACVEAREALLDMAENKLVDAIEDGQTAAILFALKTVGKHRGYVERTETTGADGGPIQYHDADYDVSQIPTDELRDIRSRIRPLRRPGAAPEKSA